MPVPDDEGFIFRVPREALPVIAEIAERTGFKQSQVARALLLHAINNLPEWAKDASEQTVGAA